MLRQGRYRSTDFISDPNELKLVNDEIIVSEKHYIVIGMEPHQVKRYTELKGFIMEIIRSIPRFDDETQDYYEIISDDSDFPHSLEVIWFADNEVILDYWSEEVNNQFNIKFSFENNIFRMKEWNGMKVD